MIARGWPLVAGALLLAASGDDLRRPRAPVVPTVAFFTDVSKASGLQEGDFSRSPPAGLAINDHSRLAFCDLDGDGWDDVVMHSLFPNALAGVPFEHLVFRNRRDGRFVDVSDASGLRQVQAGFFAFADVDEDGDQDVFAGLDVDLGDGSTHQVLLNDGSGVFLRRGESGVEELPPYVANACFADFDGDVLLDLFVGLGGTITPVSDAVGVGRGDGTFDFSEPRLQQEYVQPSNGSVVCDYDEDGDLDVLVSTYGVSLANGLNQLWENDGSAHFRNVAVERGFASLATGNPYLQSTGFGTLPEPDGRPGTYVGSNGFGIDTGDVDGDGLFDVLLTAISHPIDDEIEGLDGTPAGDYLRKWSDSTQILINQGRDAGFAFVDEARKLQVPFNEGDVDGALVDFDNDGRLDVSLSRESKYARRYPSDAFEQQPWFGLLWQKPSGRFTSLGPGSGINDPRLRGDRMRGAQNHVWSDVDHDGDLDLLVGGRDQGGGRPNFLFRNDIGSKNRWIAVRVVGDGLRVCHDAFGTRLVVEGKDFRMLRETKGSRGMYNSEDTRVVHLGLGGRAWDFTLHVHWTNGEDVAIPSDALPEGRFVTIRYPDVVEVVDDLR
ncbi:MAG: CRTAC1 family protein [Planctomycetes bacterium]|nr:CRTAC1 family protein [Planctomycetota bacterium]